MHRRLQSIKGWLSPLNNSYAFSPLPASQLNSPDILGGGSNAFPPNTSLSRKLVPPAVLNLWQWVSPPLVILLVLSLVFRPPLKDDGILNPYACKSKAMSSSLAMMCEADPKQPGWTMKVRRACLLVQLVS